MSAENHICPICGTAYKYCDYCKQMLSTGITPWRAVCDTVDCYNIHMDIREVKAGRADSNVIEHLKSSLRSLEENNVRLRESVSDYLSTLDVLKEKPTEVAEAKADIPDAVSTCIFDKKKNRK